MKAIILLAASLVSTYAFAKAPIANRLTCTLQSTSGSETELTADEAGQGLAGTIKLQNNKGTIEATVVDGGSDTESQSVVVRISKTTQLEKQMQISDITVSAGPDSSGVVNVISYSMGTMISCQKK